MPLNAPGIEAASVLFAGLLVWLSALMQHFSNVLERGAQYVMSDRSVAPAVQGFFGRATRTLSNNIESALMYVPVVLVLTSRVYERCDLAGGGDLYRRAGRLLNFLLVEYPCDPVRRLARGHGLLRGDDGQCRPDFRSPLKPSRQKWNFGFP